MLLKKDLTKVRLYDRICCSFMYVYCRGTYGAQNTTCNVRLPKRQERVAERDANNNIEYKCGKVEAEIEENIDGSKAIKKIIKEE